MFKEFVQIQAMLLMNFDEVKHHTSIRSLRSIMIDQPFLNIMIANSMKETKHANFGQSTHKENLCTS